jgi:methylenetetrahydrofolate dehydrogenase (NADP+)/methenyltetrahydrofolate cyclohydrolase
MAERLMGVPVRDEIRENIKEKVNELRAAGTAPKIATFRVGEDDGEKYYESSIIKQASNAGIESVSAVFPEGTSQEVLEEALKDLNDDPSVHGIILLMPFPEGVDEDRMTSLLSPDKDIDSITDRSMADLFARRSNALYACTAESCMEILRYYGIELVGKKATIVGRSTRVGKPLSLMMLNANATVTICHSRTPEEDIKKYCREADIVVLATGMTEHYGPEFFRDGQTVIDVGTGTNKEGKMAGDLDIDAVESDGSLENIRYTPVPGGVGSVTTALLLRNVVRAAIRGSMT